jgi:xanthine dehydrogenase accessory factor
MHEREAILALWNDTEKAAIATVVEVKGSAYRRPGARMLLTSDGRSAGVINGGCLDADLQARAAQVMESGQAQLACYDTTSSQDIVFGLGLGCRGIVKILVEPVDNLDYLQVRSDQKVAVATLYEHEITTAHQYSSEVPVGARVVWRDCPFEGVKLEENELPHDDWASQIASDVCKVLGGGNSFCRDYATETGRVRAFVELIAPPQQLLIFGAGADVVPLEKLGKTIGWDVQVLDLRAPSPERPIFVSSQHVAPDALLQFEIPFGAACVIMTHNFLHDLELLKVLLPSTADYIGILGPRRRTDELLEKMTGETLLPPFVATEAQLDRLFAPIGLDLGAETPEEIALSIIAEIQRVKRSKSGQSLREKNAIH